MSQRQEQANEKLPQSEKLDERFKPLPPEKIFTRGLIEVEFAKSAVSGVESWDFDHEDERKEFAHGWGPELTKILAKFKLLKWKPSFPLKYPWSRESNEQARVAFFKAGRDRFVTFSFPLDENVRGIARELREVAGIKQAVPIPDIAPPAGPLAEPLIGEGAVVTTSATSTLTNQWYLFHCGVPDAWLHATGKGVVIADIDWGFNLTHEDLRFRVAETRNTLNLPNTSVVSNGNRRQHGNAVLGLAGAAVNDLGMAGIAFEATLWAIQAGTEAVTCHNNWAAAINFVRSTPSPGRKVIILEIQTAGGGNIEMIPVINKEIVEAINNGIVVCVPAGNGNRSAGIGDDGIDIPETGSILVGATRFDPDPEINQRFGSNGGDRVVIYAPGDLDHDLTCGRDGYVERFGGTSGATAKVAGVVALMLEKNDQLSPYAVGEILKGSQKDVVDQDDPTVVVGKLLDAGQAVNDAIAGV